MQDCFGKEISVGDFVVYATRQGSSQHMNVAVVDDVLADKVKATVIAGTNYDWLYGQMKWDEVTKSYEQHLIESRKVTLRTSGNLIVVTGIDAQAIHDRVVNKQRENIAKQNDK